ncbi:MAG TPA: hypothetical protein VF335_02820 [Chitinivibrionales bacterium]
MLIGSISNTDSMSAFFKAVDAARKRSSMGVEANASATSFSAMRKTQPSATVAPSSLFQAYGNKSSSGTASTVSALQARQPASAKRVLGNFFDAYA